MPPDWQEDHAYKIGELGLTLGGIAVTLHDPLTEEEDAALAYFDVVYLAIEGLSHGSAARLPIGPCS